MFVVKATQSFTQLATKAIVVLVLIFHLKNGKWNIDIEMGLSQILILILILKWNSAKFWFWFWYWNGTCQILILISILNWDSAKFWYWFWNWNGTRPNIDFDFDIEMGLAKYWFWYWIAKPDIAHVPKGYPFCMLISAFKYGCMGPWPHTMAALPVHHYKVLR